MGLLRAYEREMKIIGKLGAVMAFFFTTFATVDYVNQKYGEAKAHADTKFESTGAMLKDIKESVGRIEKRVDQLYNSRRR